MSEKIKLAQNYFMKLHKTKTLKQIIGKRLNHKQRFLGSQWVCNFCGQAHGDIKGIGFTETFVAKEKGGENEKKELQSRYLNLEHNVASLTYLYKVLNDVWEPLRPCSWQASTLRSMRHPNTIEKWSLWQDWMCSTLRVMWPRRMDTHLYAGNWPFFPSSG